jgi:hypothetical protein
MLEKADVFTAGERGFAGYRILGIVVTKACSVLAYCEAPKYSKADWGEIEIHLRRNTFCRNLILNTKTGVAPRETHRAPGFRRDLHQEFVLLLTAQ